MSDFFFHCYDKEEEKTKLGMLLRFPSNFTIFLYKFNGNLCMCSIKRKNIAALFDFLLEVVFFADISLISVRLHCTRKFTESHELTEFKYYLFLWLSQLLLNIISKIGTVFAMNYSCCAVFIGIFSFFDCSSLLSN